MTITDVIIATMIIDIVTVAVVIAYGITTHVIIATVSGTIID